MATAVGIAPTNATSVSHMANDRVTALRIPPGTRVQLRRYDTADTLGWHKEAAKRELEKVKLRLEVLQQRLFAEERRSVLLVLLNGPVEVGALRTDALGQFDFDALAAASYRLSIRKEGFISSAIAVVATDGTAQPMPIFLTSLCADYWPIPYCRC